MHREMSRSQSQPRNQSVKGIVERCKSRGSIEIIDIDDKENDVVSTNAAKTSNQRSRDSRISRGTNCHDDDVISIESIDDEDGNVDDGDSDALRNNSPLSGESQIDECMISSKRGYPPSELSEHMRKYYDLGLSNQFGIDFSSESCSSKSNSTEFDSESIDSDSNDSDCEIIEDSSGNVRKQWEMAALKKKMSDRVKFGSEEQSFASRSSTNEQATQSKVDIKNCMDKFCPNCTQEIPAESYSDHNPSCGKNLPDMGIDTNFDIPYCKKNAETTDLKTHPNTNTGHKDCDLTPEICSHKAQPTNESLTEFVQSGFEEAFDQPSICNYQVQVHKDMICKRERIKESDEYRCAVEEECAARQHLLEIQAEEAQRLKRKREAETLRLLDMERRQKQRLEEIRESQKKDEETINMKEHLRLEVRKDLEKMELRYRDMASLLRGLGINVEGGLYPMPHEVNAAYKQALLRFHPDRASRSDIHQQVKAEETFKLISRLKDKLLPVM